MEAAKFKTMVSSRSDTKRRRRDTSPIDTNPKRTKVHAQRKFAQGVSSLSNLLQLTPVKEKSEKPHNASSGNLANGLKPGESLANICDVVTAGKRVPPARGAKKPSIEDMITFLCYRGTTALPSHLVHLNKAPSPEPASHSPQGSSENPRSRLVDKSKESEKGTKKPLKSAASSALKAVNAAQALKRKYQEQRIKKTSVSTLTSKVKSTPILRTTRSSAGAVNISPKTLQKKVGTKRVDTVPSSKRKDHAHKENSKSANALSHLSILSSATFRTPLGKQSGSSSAVVVTPSSGNRGGLRSGKVATESVSRSSVRNLGTNVPLKTKKKGGNSSLEGVSPQSKKLATSLSDFSSEDDQPLVKKPKPLVQVKKLIKKSIANIGRKMKLEPRRSQRGLSASPASPITSSRLLGLVHGQSNVSILNNHASGAVDDESKQKTGGKKFSAASPCKDFNGLTVKSQSNDHDKREIHTSSSSTPGRMKKGYVMELVCDNTGVTDSRALETRSRRGSRDIRDMSVEDKPGCVQENVKMSVESKKKEAARVSEQSKLKPSTIGAASKSANTKALPSTPKSQLELSLSAVLKSPPDLRIPSSIKRPLTAVGITNPMAIAAAAAVVCKSSSSKLEENAKAKVSLQCKDNKDKKDTRKRETPSGNLKSLKSKSCKEEGRTPTEQSKSKEDFDSKDLDSSKMGKQAKMKSIGTIKKKSDDTSDEDTKPIINISSKDSKLSKVKGEVKEEDAKITRTSRKSGVKVVSEEDESSITANVTGKRSSDEEESKPSRARRSNIRVSKKAILSDEEGNSMESCKNSEKTDAKAALQLRKKNPNPESDQDQKKKHNTRHGKIQSSEDEISVKRHKKDKKKISQPSKPESSENDKSDEDNISDDINPSTSKPSTRSTAKCKAQDKKLSRSTRSGKKFDNSEENSVVGKGKVRSKAEVFSTEEESDSETFISPTIPKTRSRAVRKSHNKRGASTDSSDEESNEKVSTRGRRSLKKIVTVASNSTSNESSSNSSLEDDDLIGDQLCQKTRSKKSDSKFLSKKSIRKISSTEDTAQSSDRDGKRKKDVEVGSGSNSRGRQSRSPRRSSRRSTSIKNNDSKSVSSTADASSSDSSPSQNRRVLRKRRGFFSFAEVDPPSDSEEDVIAATKASLEMIKLQQSSDSAGDAKNDIPEQAPVLKSSEADTSGSKQEKKSLQEIVKCTKKTKPEISHTRKVLSKKRIKPVSEVQSDLNDELEKTLLSINLSPKMPSVSEKSLPDNAFDSDRSSAPEPMDSSQPILTPVSFCPEVPVAPSQKPRTSASTKSAVMDSSPSIIPSTSSALAIPVSTTSSTSSTVVSGSLVALTTVSQIPSTTMTKCSLNLGATLVSSSGSSLTVNPVPTAQMPSVAAPSGSSSNLATNSNIGAKITKLVKTSSVLMPTSLSTSSVGCSPTFSSAPILVKGSSVSCNVLPIPPSGSLSTTASSSALGLPSTVFSASGQLLTQVPSALSTAVSASMTSSVTTPLPASLALPISSPITLSTQLGIPMQTSGNLPISVPMSGTMTVPLQVGSLSSGTSAAPFLLPVQSALTPMLTQGQTIIKKDSGTLAGMTNSVGNAPLMVGMNPLVVNSNRGTIFLSTGSTMTMTSSQQQMVPGPIMPSLLSLRLPDKPQQTIMASSPLYVPLAFGNTGIIQTQGQVQPQIQALAGVSTITAMATNMQNSMATNMPNPMATNLCSSMASNLQTAIPAGIQNTISTNVQNSIVTNIQSASASNSLATNIQNSSSLPSAMTLTQAQGTGTGTKRQLVLANKNGTVSKLILSVGEDGSHVLAAASPNAVSSSEGQTLMSVMQPVQSLKPSGLQVTTTSSNQTLQAMPTVSLKQTSSFPSKSTSVSKGLQSSVSVTAASQPMKQATSSSLNTTMTYSSLAAPGSTVSGNTSPISPAPLPSKALHSTLLSKAPIAAVSSAGAAVTSIVPSPSNVTCMSVTSTASLEASTVRSGSSYLHMVSSSSSLNPVPPSVMSSGSKTSSETSKANTVNTVACGRPLSSPIKTDLKQGSLASIRSSTSLPISSVVKSQEKLPAPNMSKISSKLVPAVCSSSSSNKPLMSVKSSIHPETKAAGAGSPARNVVPASDLSTSSPSTTMVTNPTLTSRIPSAPAALAALKTSGIPASTRAIAKTGSSRKPYSTAASYAAAKTSDSGEISVPSTSPAPAGSGQLPSPIAKVTNSQIHGKLTSPSKETASKLNMSLSSHISEGSLSTPASTPDVKRKGTEVELASTHRTLAMLSTAFQGLEKKRDISVKKVSHAVESSCPSDKLMSKLNVEKSGLDSLAEAATSLAKRSSDGTSCDKRIPEHSLWANPAQILGKETLRVPGLPITANVGTNLPTKNELAKMKSGAVLADAIEKHSLIDVEKLCKGRGSSPGGDCEKPTVSGLLSGSTAETPCQKVQKWLEDGSNLEVEHKHNCHLLSNGTNCTCDGIEEDISNLNSLADVCVSMERINSPSKEQKMAKPSNKIASEKKKKNEGPSESILSSPSKSSLPIDSDQMKVTWRNAFGVKSPSKGNKIVTSCQSKRPTLNDELKKSQMSSEKVGPSGGDCNFPTVLFGQNHGKQSKKKGEGTVVTDEISHETKLTQRKSLLGRASDPSTNLKLDNTAFSAVNESSVYAFEAETDTPAVSQPFRRMSKTLSRSDEEDSTSVGSITHPLTVHVSKDPVYVPVQEEADENISSSELLRDVPSEKSCNASSDSQNDDDVYYIPLGGEEGHDGNVRAVAVRLGKKGPNNHVVMIKMEATTHQHSGQQSSTHSAITADKFLDLKNTVKNSSNKTKLPLEKNKRESQSSLTDSSGEDTLSLNLMPLLSSSSKDSKELKCSMSPASSRNKSPISDIASQSNSKTKSRLNRQSSIDSDVSEKAKSSRRGSKAKSTSSCASPAPSLPSTSSTSSGPSRPSQKSNRSYNGPVPGNISEAPVFHPTEKEFQDPYAYIEKIRPIAEKYGLCRIVAPNSFKPDCNVEDDIRFTADNQYVHKMMDRWGPNAKEMRAIVKYIAQHNIHLKHPPLVGGMELDLPRLYTTVQNFGGLMEVMDKKRWVKVAETMRIPKSAQDRASKLDEVYCKCLLPYETLKTGERDNLFEMVEVEWEMRKERRDKRLNASASSPDEPAGSHDEDDEDDDDEDSDADEEDECIVKGRSMPLTTFYRTARNTTHMWFKGNSPSASEVEHEFWRHVRDRNFHICVNAGSVDCSDPPYGFPTRNSPFAKHPWNLKVFSSSNGSVLRSLGSIIGVTVPTLHFGMVFTTCCWYRDPHGLPWIEYLHTGAKKIWYGIPEHGSEKFRSAMQEVAPHYVRKKALWLASDTAMIPPNMLTERKVPLCRTVQEPGQFIVVFPRAHTSSVATGYIVSESVSFAPPSWLLSAMESFREMQNCNEPPLFSLDKLIFAIAEDPRSSLNVLNTILSSVMEILEREITSQQELKKKGITSIERMEKSKKKAGGKKSKIPKEPGDGETLECEVCSTILFLSMVVNKEDQSRYCLAHASTFVDQEKLSPSQCKLLYTYTQNELHEFCQNLLDRIEAKSGRKGNNASGSISDSGSSASTSTRN
ncbi:Protein Jumonji [Frankliniella fusca]|uniref:Protein Jumonji n=1 Tax=Frankliniella fusca TaxID=407009 RepID=A0AAE1H1G2_9NEOP|nr:Protein Jumonji [Frankliniella fusca]